jgi:crossover junction endodeoxyribonuclease RuvC
VRILGGDPGIGDGGAAVIERIGAEAPRVLHVSTISTDTKQSIDERIGVIFDRFGALVREFHPDAIALEEQRGVQVGKWREGKEFNSDNSKTHYATCALVCAAWAYGCKRVVWVTPQQLKIAVLGKGGRVGSKDAVKEAVRGMIERGGFKRFSGHAADAVAAAITAERQLHWGGLQERRA